MQRYIAIYSALNTTFAVSFQQRLLQVKLPSAATEATPTPECLSPAWMLERNDLSLGSYPRPHIGQLQGPYKGPIMTS